MWKILDDAIKVYCDISNISVRMYNNEWENVYKYIYQTEEEIKVLYRNLYDNCKQLKENEDLITILLELNQLEITNTEKEKYKEYVLSNGANKIDDILCFELIIGYINRIKEIINKYILTDEPSTEPSTEPNIIPIELQTYKGVKLLSVMVEDGYLTEQFKPTEKLNKLTQAQKVYFVHRANELLNIRSKKYQNGINCTNWKVWTKFFKWEQKELTKKQSNQRTNNYNTDNSEIIDELINKAFK